MIELEIEYHEEYCGGFGCTPNGCSGHSTGVPAAIILNGFRLTNPELNDGEPLSDDEVENKKEWQRWQSTVEELSRLFKNGGG